VYLIFRKKFI